MTDSITRPLPAIPEVPHWILSLPGDARVLIRFLRREDAAAERRFIESLSPSSRRNRFLGQMASPGNELIERLTNVDQVNDVALVAVVEEAGHERIIGDSRYASDVASRSCECAVVVADEWQRMGVGTALMQHLIEAARERGLDSMQSIELAENAEIRDLARKLGFECRPCPGDARQIVCVLRLDPRRTGAAGHPGQ